MAIVALDGADVGSEYAPANWAGPSAPAGGALAASGLPAAFVTTCASQRADPLGAAAHECLNQWPRP